MKYLRIGFAGSGNVAWHLAQDLEKAGHFIPVVYSRSYDQAHLLASQLYDTRIGESADFSEFELDVLVLAVSDDALEQLAQDIVVGAETIVVHTSGAKSISVLSHLGDDFGVFYPLQSFTKERGIDLSQVPICIEANNTRVHEVLFMMAKSLSSKVVVMDSERRLMLHLAAVFANNFTNHMLFWAKTIAENEDIDFQLLKPLALETVEKAFGIGPEGAQTGPARRGDSKTMQLHLSQLEANIELTTLYKNLSKSIQFNS